jgi:uncharacterized membrane protein
MREERPKIQVLPSPWAATVEIGAWFLVIILIVWVSTVLGQLPSRIPVHFGADGAPNRWGSPSELWILVGVNVFVVGLLAVIRRVVAPYDMNIPVRVTIENAPRIYRLTLDLLCVLQFVIAIVFLIIFFTIIQTVHQELSNEANKIIFVATLLLILGTVGFYFVRLLTSK